MKKLLIVISACNEAASLNVFLPKLVKVAKSLLVSTDILLINDGSTDNTAEIAVSHGCQVINNPENLGIGASLHSGYKEAFKNDFDFVVTMDADGQHDASILPGIVDLILGGEVDIIVASRYHKDSERFGVPLDRDLLNISVTAQMKFVTGWNITDPLSGFWCMTKDCYKFALDHGRQERYGIHLENLIKFWHLLTPRPRHIEVPHPAIYDNHGTHSLLTRVYSNANQEDRLHRFGTHALHILEAINDVRSIIGAASISLNMESRRYR